MHIAYHPNYLLPLPEGHRFPMIKYELIPEQLIYEGVITVADLYRPAQCTHDILSLTHQNEYLQKLYDQQLTEREQRAIGFPQSKALIEREICIAQGTIDCALAALQQGVALNVAGGTHHSFADKGEGFCILNDMAIAANYLLYKTLAKKIVIIDLDVHQGNGTAAIFAKQSNVYTFSMHGAHNYPFRKETSDWDIGLVDGVGDSEYLAILNQALLKIITAQKPDFVFYLSGVDVLATDKFGKMNLSLNGCKQRDEMVFEMLHKHQIPCAVAMGGGYTPDVRKVVTAHCNTFKAAQNIWG